MTTQSSRFINYTLLCVNITLNKLYLLHRFSNFWALSKSEFLTSCLSGCFIHQNLGTTEFNNVFIPYKFRTP